jgi:Protein of unknown function (DUF1501)
MLTNRVSRRDALRLSAAGVLGGCVAPWFNVLTARAKQSAEEGAKHKSCILLWMAGGPAQSHTFDLKSGGPYLEISTAVPGIKISEHLPKVAKQAKNFTLLRGMKTGDGNHPTATYLMHTGFRRGQGGVVHPSMGSIVSSELGQPDFDLPNYVALGTGLGAGHLGPKFSPIRIEPGSGLPDLKPADTLNDFDQRASLLEELDSAFHTDYQAAPIKAHQVTVERAVRLMHSVKTKAFDLSQEPSSMRDKYGNNRFGQGCLLARRLVEVGVPFVEVSLNGWDTHAQANERVKKLSEQLDPAMGTLIGDLKERGLLDDTLVIWAGEFGRSPGNGSNHFARAWTTLLAGGGLKHGQVVGKTNAKGDDVADRPVSAADFMATICKALGIDHTKEWTTRSGRPIAKVGKGAQPVRELFAA